MDGMISPAPHAANWQRLRTEARLLRDVEEMLALSPPIPTGPSFEYATRALGPHIPCPELYARQAEESERQAHNCRNWRPQPHTLRMAERWDELARYWCGMEQQQRFIREGAPARRVFA